MSLPKIYILWRQPDTLTLWGVPYEMRPGQQPSDLWKAGNTKGWVYMGEPGWWGSYDEERRLDVEAFLRAYHDLIPGNPCEWCRLPTEQ